MFCLMTLPFTIHKHRLIKSAFIAAYLTAEVITVVTASPASGISLPASIAYRETSRFRQNYGFQFLF